MMPLHRNIVRSNSTWIKNLKNIFKFHAKLSHSPVTHPFHYKLSSRSVLFSGHTSLQPIHRPNCTFFQFKMWWKAETVNDCKKLCTKLVPSQVKCSNIHSNVWVTKNVSEFHWSFSQFGWSRCNFQEILHAFRMHLNAYRFWVFAMNSTHIFYLISPILAFL